MSMQPTPAWKAFVCLMGMGCVVRAEPTEVAKEPPTFEVVSIGKDDTDYRARALNDHGTVVGQVGTVWTAPWRWRAGDEEPEVLPFLPKWEKAEGRKGENLVAKVQDINNQGVAVGSGGGDYQAFLDPVRWTEEGEVEDLGDLPDAAREGGAAEHITADGTIYGWTWNADGEKVRFKWTEETGMKPHAGAIPEETSSPEERWVRQALDTRALGEMVDPEEVPRFRVEKQFQPGPEYFNDLKIQDINNAGQIVGWKRGPFGTQHAYLLTPKKTTDGPEGSDNQAPSSDNG